MSSLEQQLSSRIGQVVAWYRSSTWARIALALAGFGLIALVTYLIAHARMYYGFANYDDEGYVLTALHSFIDRGNLYDDVFTQYGPFYYEAFGTLFSVFSIPATLDGGRAVTMVVWIATALGLGVAAARITGSLLLGLATQILSFAALNTLTNEPMHPGGIIVALLAVIVLFSCLVRGRTAVAAAALLGGAVAALILVKINVGAFALAALALVCVLVYAPLAERRWPRILVEVGIVLLPLALMSSKFPEAWARDYAVHVSIAALALVIALRAREVGRRPTEELRWIVGGLVGVGVVCCLAIMVTGTSPAGLLDGLIRQPLRQADAFTIAFGMSKRVFLFDAIALAGALAYLYAARGRRPGVGVPSGGGAALPLITIFVGLQLALSPIGKTFPFDSTGLGGYELSLLAFVWVALIPQPGREIPGTSFARLLLPPLAVLQSLHAYPVAGSQTLWAALLLVPVGAICVGNGVRALAAVIGDERERRALAALGAVAAVAVLGFIANAELRESLKYSRGAYDSAHPLDLPGARDVRLPEEDEVERYTEITEAIKANCSSFVMLPGMDSFYVWTEIDPPTDFNATGWTTLFDDAHQERVISDVEDEPGLCLLENEGIAAGWAGGEIPEGPLVNWMRKEFEPLLSVGDYDLLVRDRGSRNSS